MRRRFVTLDVFTDKRFAGNPLAVVIDGEDLDTAVMQTIAREFNLSETVFVQPPEGKGHRAKLRIFTPARELPFAGHPTVGTAVLLARLDGGQAVRDFVLEEKVGLVPCRVQPSADGGRATFDIPRASAKEAETRDTSAMAAAVGLSAADVGLESFPTERWSAGNPFTFLPVKGLDAIGRVQIDVAAFNKAFGGGDHAAAFIFCREASERDHDFHARMFAPVMGVHEDPATGSAVAAFSGYLAAHGGYKDGEHRLRVEQGYEMGRPSVIELTLKIAGGKLTGASIGGGAVIMMDGTIEA